MSHFKRDLDKELLLGKYLDTVYKKLNLKFERVSDINKQYQGVDLIYSKKDNIYIDEKAQLDYIGKNLPTFTFELSYLKNENARLGWLLDSSKITTHYFLVTGIEINNSKFTEGFKSCIITSVSREKLLKYLNMKGLDKTRLLQYDSDLRASNTSENRHLISELDEKTEGLLYYSPQLTERPINLQLRLKHLIKIGVAKQIYPH